MSEEPLLHGEDWGTVVRVEVWPGESHDWARPEADPAPWRVIDDPEEVAVLVDALRGAVPLPGPPAPVLAGVRLSAYSLPPVADDAEDHGWVGMVDLISPNRAQSYGRDHLLPAPLPAGLFGRPDAEIWAPELADAVARAERGIVPAGLPDLTASWDAAWPGRVPLSFTLRGGHRWVRFHSLPGSKRYADTDEEYAEILSRHRAVLGELADGRGDVLVVTASWSGSAMPAPLLRPVAAATPGARFWRSVSEPGDDTFWHLYVERMPVDADRLDVLFRIAADDVTPVLVGDLDWAWLYAPYDGGADVFARTEQQRDELKARYVDWLPQNSSGL